MRKTIHATLPALALTAFLLPAAAGAQQGQPQPGQPQPGQRDAEIEVEAPRPEVQVQQGAPEVQVQQQAPDVRIERGQPQIEMQQAQPQVNVQQPGRPEVMVERPPERTEAQVVRPGETQVQVRLGEPDIRIESAEPQVQVERAQAEPKIEIVRMTRREAEMEDAGIGRNDLIGMEVVGSTGDDVGEVDDVILGPEGQRLDRVVVRMGGGLFGGEERLVAVPWTDVQVDPQEKRVRLPMDEEQVKQAPPFQYAGQERRLSEQAKAEVEAAEAQPRQAQAGGQERQPGQRQSDDQRQEQPRGQ